MREQRDLSQPYDQFKPARSAILPSNQVTSVFQRKRHPDQRESQKPSLAATGCFMGTGSAASRQNVASAAASLLPEQTLPSGSKRKRWISSSANQCVFCKIEHLPKNLTHAGSLLQQSKAGVHCAMHRSACRTCLDMLMTVSPLQQVIKATQYRLSATLFVSNFGMSYDNPMLHRQEA